MDAKQWSAATSKAEKEAVCAYISNNYEDMNPSRAYISQIATGVRDPSPRLAKALVAASAVCTPENVMTLQGLRSDIWGSPVERVAG